MVDFIGFFWVVLHQVKWKIFKLSQHHGINFFIRGDLKCFLDKWFNDTLKHISCDSPPAVCVFMIEIKNWFLKHAIVSHKINKVWLCLYCSSDLVFILVVVYSAQWFFLYNRSYRWMHSQAYGPNHEESLFFVDSFSFFPDADNFVEVITIDVSFWINISAYGFPLRLASSCKKDSI